MKPWITFFVTVFTIFEFHHILTHENCKLPRCFNGWHVCCTGSSFSKLISSSADTSSIVDGCRSAFRWRFFINFGLGCLQHQDSVFPPRFLKLLLCYSSFADLLGANWGSPPPPKRTLLLVPSTVSSPKTNEYFLEEFQLDGDHWGQNL